jgi:hypothetical protein
MLLCWFSLDWRTFLAPPLQMTFYVVGCPLNEKKVHIIMVLEMHSIKFSRAFSQQTTSPYHQVRIALLYVCYRCRLRL